jgi:hypothetical protein
MSPARRFPFGKDPAPTHAPSTTLLPPPLSPPNPLATVPLVDFLPPGRTLPFRDPPPTPDLPTEPIPVVVPLPPPRPRKPQRFSLPTAAWVVLLVLDVLVLAYLAATWRP